MAERLIALPPEIGSAHADHPFFSGERLDLESRRVHALRTGDRDEGVKQAIATKLVALAKAGERNPDILCEQVLRDIRRARV
jgi:hypothetical protein